MVYVKLSPLSMGCTASLNAQNPLTLSIHSDGGSLAFDGEQAAPTIWWTKQGDLSTFSKLSTTTTTGWASAHITHFSEGAVGNDTCEPEEEADDGDEAEEAPGNCENEDGEEAE